MILDEKKVKDQNCDEQFQENNSKLKRGEVLVRFALIFLFLLLLIYVIVLFVFGYLGIRQTSRLQDEQDMEIKKAHEFALGKVLEAQALVQETEESQGNDEEDKLNGEKNVSAKFSGNYSKSMIKSD